MLEIKLGVNLEVKLGVGSQTGSKKSVLAFQKCTDGSVLVFLKCTDGSVLVFPKCMDCSVLAHLRFPMQSAPTRFPQSENSEVPKLLGKKNVLFKIYWPGSLKEMPLLLHPSRLYITFRDWIRVVPTIWLQLTIMTTCHLVLCYPLATTIQYQRYGLVCNGNPTFESCVEENS